MGFATQDKIVARAFRRGAHESRLQLGDCLELMDRVPDNSVHLILTDPPYFLDRLDGSWNDGRIGRSKAKAGVVGGLPVGMKFDRNQGRALQAFFGRVAEKAARVLCPGGFFIAFSAPRLYHRMAVAMDDAGFEIRDMYAWHYRRAAQQKAFSQDHFVRKMKLPEKEKRRLIKALDGRKTPQLRPQFEPLVIAQNPRDGTFVENWMKWRTGLVDTKTVRLDGRVPTTLMPVEKPIKDGHNSHLTVKPVPLMEALIKIFTVSGQTVLDPFVGSGTTLLAARNARRTGVGMEINKAYYEIAAKRLEEETQ